MLETHPCLITLINFNVLQISIGVQAKETLSAMKLETAMTMFATVIGVSVEASANMLVSKIVMVYLEQGCTTQILSGPKCFLTFTRAKIDLVFFPFKV